MAAPVAWPKRLLHLALGGVIVLAVSLSWPLAVDLTPADLRPWVGGSQTNSVLELALGYNGLGRVTGQGEIGGRGGGGPPAAASPAAGNPGFGRGFGGGTPGGRGGVGGNATGGLNGAGMGMFGAGFAGPLRLFTGGELAEQWSWLVPLAVLRRAGRGAGPAAALAAPAPGAGAAACGAAGWSPMASSSAWPRASSTPTT